MTKLDEKTNGIIPKSENKTQKIEKKELKVKRSYRVDVRMPNGKRITKTFHRKFDAEQFKAKLRISKQRIEETGIDLDRTIKFKDFVEIWFKDHIEGRRAERTVAGYRSNFKNYITPILGELNLNQINYYHAKQLENFILKSGVKARTVNKVMMVLKTLLNEAVKLEYMIKNPIKGYAELTEQAPQLEYWSKDDIKQFIDANRENPILDFYIVVLNTGLRLGEICGLCWDRVDFDQNYLTINRSLTREGLKNTTKTNQTRYVPMNGSVRAILLERLKSRVSEFVFSSPSGEPLPYCHINQRHFKNAQHRAELTKIIRFHDLRHTYASHFMMNGGNLYTLQKLLGHTDIKTTMIYAHLDKDFLTQASKIVDIY